MPMSRMQKTVATSLWGVLVVATLVVASAVWTKRRQPAAAPTPPVSPTPVPAFALLDQNGRPFTNAEMKGKVWVADFIFTRCTGPCPMMTQKMAQMQQAVGSANVHMVSFTVDPAHDTPEVLKAYARQYGADESRWTLATGSSSELETVSRGFLIGLTPAAGAQPIMHGTHFVLVDADGMVRGWYGSSDEGSIRQLEADAIKLAGIADRSARR